MILIRITKFCVFLFIFQLSLCFYAQETRVIDNKGTLKTIGNNRVFTTIDDNTLVTSTLSSTLSEGDIWYDLNSYTVTVGGSTQTKTRGPIKVYEYVRDNLGEVTSKQWKQISYKGQKGSVFFADDDGNTTENNTHFFWDNTTPVPSNNIKGHYLFLGVRNNSIPNNYRTKLNVNGAVTSTYGYVAKKRANTLAYRFLEDTNTGITSSLADNLSLFTGGIEALHINSLQNIGIGTATPTVRLDIDGEARIRILNTGTVTNTILVADENGVVKKLPTSTLGSTVTSTNISGSMRTRTIAIHKAGGTTTTTSINETVTALTQENGNTATATISVTLPEGQTTTQTTKTIATYQNEETATVTINETVTDIAQTLSNTTNASKTFTFVANTSTTIAITATNTTKPIATYINENTETTTINETVTSLVQDTNTSTTSAGNIFYTNEAGKTYSATVVSKNPNNSIKVGSDGGAFFSENHKSIITTSTPYTINDNDYTIIVDAISSFAPGDDIIEIPDASANNGRIIIIKNVSFESIFTDQAYKDFFNLDETEIPDTYIVKLQSDGTQWHFIGGY